MCSSKSIALDAWKNNAAQKLQKYPVLQNTNFGAMKFSQMWFSRMQYSHQDLPKLTFPTKKLGFGQDQKISKRVLAIKLSKTNLTL